MEREEKERATRRVSVTVTADHVSRSRWLLEEGTSRASCCPVALALRDAGLEEACVSNGHVSYGGRREGEGQRTVGLPDPAWRFVRKFDVGADVSGLLPLSFVLPGVAR